MTNCTYCNHEAHPEGQKCGVQDSGKKKPCKCKAKPGFWSDFGNALGEALFGGGR